VHDAQLVFNIGWFALSAALPGDAFVAVSTFSGSLVLGHVAAGLALVLLYVVRHHSP
jgi:hypothetical protein